MRARKRNPWLYGNEYDKRQARRLRRRAAHRMAENFAAVGIADSKVGKR